MRRYAGGLDILTAATLRDSVWYKLGSNMVPTEQYVLASLLAGVPHRLMAGTMQCAVAGVTADSRHVTPGALFVAIRGLQTDGHGFVESALDQGAAALVVEELTPRLLQRVQAHGQTVVQVAQSRQALAQF